MEQETANNEQRLRDLMQRKPTELTSIIEYLPVGVLIADSSGITTCNRRSLEMFGLLEEAVLRQGFPGVYLTLNARWTDTGIPLSLEDSLFLRGLRGEACSGKITFTNATTGDEVMVQSAVTPIREKEKGAVVAAVMVNTEITPLIRAEQALLESEERFRTLADSMPQLVWATRPDGYHVYYNRRWYEYTGLSEDESRGFGFATVLHPEDQERTLARWRRAWEGGEGYEIEYRFRRSDGVYRWFVGRAMPVRDPNTGIITRWVGTCTDVDDLQKVKRDLEHNEAHLKLAVDAALLGTWELEIASGQLSVSDRFRDILQLPRQTLVRSEDWFSRIHPADRERMKTAFAAFLEGRQELAEEYRLLVGPGGGRWVSTRGMLQTDRHQKPLRAVGIVADTTEANEKARLAEAHTEKLNRLNEAVLAINSEASVEKILQALAEKARYVFGTHRAATLCQVGTEPGRAVHCVSVSDWLLRQSHDPPRLSAGGDDLLRLETYLRQPGAAQTGEMTLRVDDWLIAPLVARDGRRFGGLALADKVAGEFDTDDENLLARVAQVASVALENQMLLDQTQAAERRAAEAAAKNERIAATLQQSLLLTPPENAFPGIQLDTDYEAAWEDAQVGGDFYDAFALTRNRVALVVGDVTGKGLEAASYTAELKFALRSLLREHQNPATALSRLNQFLIERQQLEGRSGSALACATVALLDCTTGEVTIACAGAEPPLLIRKQDGAAEEIYARGPLLGVLESAEFTPVASPMGSGDLLILVTDGITEARRGREFFGLDGVARVASACREAISIETITRSIVTSAKSFAAGKLRDDVCILVVRRALTTPG